MFKPTKNTRWAWKAVSTTLTTRNNFKWPIEGLVKSSGPWEIGSECPAREGDGLCLALTPEGAAAGGYNPLHSVVLLVSFNQADVLGESDSKIRVRKCRTHGVIDARKHLIRPGAGLRLANLRGADLSRADLSMSDLRGANLRLANLRGADLSRADLSMSDLRGASLYRADLSGANLGGANLGGADLYGANLSMSDLRGANLGEANLRGADLSRADLRGADLRGADLSRANLDGVIVMNVN